MDWLVSKVRRSEVKRFPLCWKMCELEGPTQPLMLEDKQPTVFWLATLETTCLREAQQQ